MIQSRILRIAAIAVLAVGGCCATFAQTATTARRHTVSKGTMAPDFALTTLDGKKLNFASYKGKVVVLDFWATWCVPCRAEIPGFIALQKKYGGRGLQFIGISMDDNVKPVQAFYRKFAMNYPVAVGNAKLAEVYGGILGLPVTFVIDREGWIFAKHEGEVPESTIEREIESLLSADPRSQVQRP